MFMNEVAKLAREIRDLLPMQFVPEDYAALLKIAVTIEDTQVRAALVKFADMSLAESQRRVEAFAKINSLITLSEAYR
jgi:hypothetical protein